MPVTITATRSTSLFTDQDNDGRVDQGDTLFIRLDIANSGDTDALNVVVNDLLLGQSLVAGSLNISPVAFNDSFNAVGNTQLLVGGATGLSGPAATFNGNILSNDLGALAGRQFHRLHADHHRQHRDHRRRLGRARRQRRVQLQPGRRVRGRGHLHLHDPRRRPGRRRRQLRTIFPAPPG